MLKKTVITIIYIFFTVISSYSEVTVKLKDVSFIDGLKENQVYGYGLVVGLQGTGDSKKSPASSSLNNLLKNLGIEGGEIKSKNSASVILTAKLPPFVRVGDKVNVVVSSIGDAKSLQGGILIQSQLKGSDEQVYVVAQGRVNISNSSGRGRSIKTVAAISNGGIVEKEIIPDLNKDYLSIVLRKWDYTMAANIIKAMKEKYPLSKPEMTNRGMIRINLPKKIPLYEFISSIENLEVQAEVSAKVVIDESSGVIVTGGNVKISKAMVSRKGMVVEISSSDKKVNVSHINDSSTVKDLVDVMNSIGASTGDVIEILKALNVSGALHADLIVK